MKTVVRHWRYEDGWSPIPVFLQKPGGPTREYREEIVGWHCWVYPEDDLEFVSWMKYNMHGKHDCTHRFNSGDPMYTVHIHDSEDATLFKLIWL